MGARPSLRTELLFNLAFLAAAALLLGVGTVLLVAALAPDRALPFILTTVALDVVVFIFFGRYLVSRLVLRPVERLVAVADAVAAGDFAARAPAAETRDFQVLAERLNRMTDHLLDAQSQLVRSEKLASIGRLAAGIAHEVGNPLGAIGTYVEVLRRRGADGEVVAGLTRELDRIDQIVRGLLDYARPQEEPLAPLDPVAVLRGARPWAYEPGRAAPKRATDAGRTAFPRGYERRPARVEFAAGQAGALLLVADSGPGVAAEDRDKIFEPFYTTKEPGRGTGLGLAIVARAVHDMGGVVWVDPAREGGAAFKMFFPAVPHVPPLRNAERGSGGEV